MSPNAKPFGSEIEIDGVLYVSVDFLLQYPEYLDNELDSDAVSSAEAEVAGPEEGPAGDSIYRSELSINGVTYVAVPMLKSNPNYVELKYGHKQEIELPTFVPEADLEGMGAAAYTRRRRRS